MSMSTGCAEGAGVGEGEAAAGGGGGGTCFQRPAPAKPAQQRPHREVLVGACRGGERRQCREREAARAGEGRRRAERLAVHGEHAGAEAAAGGHILGDGRAARPPVAPHPSRLGAPNTDTNTNTGANADADAAARGQRGGKRAEPAAAEAQGRRRADAVERHLAARGHAALRGAPPHLPSGWSRAHRIALRAQELFSAGNDPQASGPSSLR